MRRRTLTLALLLALVPASLLLAGAEGRLKGVVQDKDGKPIVDAKVVLTAQEVSATRQAMTKKGGKFVMIVADATRSYMIRIETEGYQTIQEPLKLTIGGQTAKTWTLLEGETVAGATVVEMHAPGAKVYNDGAKAFNNGDIDGALAKFREAGEINPELAEAFQGQAMIHWSRKETDLALAAAEKVVALDPTQRPRPARLLRLLPGEGRRARRRDAGGADRGRPDAGYGPAGLQRRRRVGDGPTTPMGRSRSSRRRSRSTASLTQGYQILGQLYNCQEEYDKAIASGEKLLAHGAGQPRGALGPLQGLPGEGRHREGGCLVGDPQGVQAGGPGADALRRGQVAVGRGQRRRRPPSSSSRPSRRIPSTAWRTTTWGCAYANINRVDDRLVHLQKFLDLDPEHPEAASAKSMLDYYKTSERDSGRRRRRG